MNALEQAFVDAVFEKCAAKDVLVIADEVQTGVGRTGTFLAGEQFGHKADVTTLAKGIAGCCLLVHLAAVPVSLTRFFNDIANHISCRSEL